MDPPQNLAQSTMGGTHPDGMVTLGCCYDHSYHRRRWHRHHCHRDCSFSVYREMRTLVFSLQPREVQASIKDGSSFLGTDNLRISSARRRFTMIAIVTVGNNGIRTTCTSSILQLPRVFSVCVGTCHKAVLSSFPSLCNKALIEWGTMIS